MRYLTILWITSISIWCLTKCKSEDKEPAPVEEPTPEEPAAEREVGVWPMSGSSEPDELASVYGPRVLSGNYDFHRGFDVRAPIGTPVHAMLAGEVVRREEGQVGSSLERLGKFIVIAHQGVEGAAQRQTAYFHLNEFGVNVGDLVEAGDVIGKSGKSGVGINTEHLHFEYQIGTNDGKQNRLNTRNPLRILPYVPMDYEVSVQKSSQTLTMKIIQDDNSADFIGVRFVPSGLAEKEIDFESRAGISASNEDTNPFDGLTITPNKFVPSSETYQLKFELAGSWDELSALTLELKDARDSIRTVTVNF